MSEVFQKRPANVRVIYVGDGGGDLPGVAELRYLNDQIKMTFQVSWFESDNQHFFLTCKNPNLKLY